MRTGAMVVLAGLVGLLGGCGLLKGTKLAPVAAIEALPQQGPAPLEVRFSGAPSHSVYGTISSFAWDFGDGATDDQMITTHTYPNPGTYIVSLRVKNSLGLDDANRVTVFVDTPPPPPPPPPPSDQTDSQENELVKFTRTLPAQVDAGGLAQVEVVIEAKVPLELVAVVESPDGLVLASGELQKFLQGLQAGDQLTLSYTLQDEDGNGGQISGTVRAKPPDAASQTLTLVSTLQAQEAAAP